MGRREIAIVFFEKFGNKKNNEKSVVALALIGTAVTIQACNYKIAYNLLTKVYLFLVAVAVGNRLR